MITCRCFVQAGQISADTETVLRANLDAFSQQTFGMPTEISWTTVPEGSGFTAAKPSTASMVVMRADKPLEQAHRATLLQELCDLWMSETNCAISEVVAIISDPEAH
ncbi:MAG: hypothetical protein AAF512_19255 [Pseudomonadota bacterium]